jgi:gamma-glutamyl hercynylcysteine S-oxide synthase
VARPLQIPCGSYVIGNDSVPNAAPRHQRSFDAPVWIDPLPVTWAHYEAFVAAGGYRREELWPPGADRNTPLPAGSVDRHVREVLENGHKLSSYLPSGMAATPQRPLTGLTHSEAVALAAFYNARLPFEAEWEVAMKGSLPQEEWTEARREWPLGFHRFPVSRLGLPVLLGTLEEWTADSFSPRYWRVDSTRMSSVGEGDKMLVRGASGESTHKHVSFRIGREPWRTSPFCGFRLVWDREPSKEDVKLIWR